MVLGYSQSLSACENAELLISNPDKITLHVLDISFIKGAPIYKLVNIEL
jgi:hypothetical protein